MNDELEEATFLKNFPVRDVRGGAPDNATHIGTTHITSDDQNSVLRGAARKPWHSEPAYSTDNHIYLRVSTGVHLQAASRRIAVRPTSLRDNTLEPDLELPYGRVRPPNRS